MGGIMNIRFVNSRPTRSLRTPSRLLVLASLTAFAGAITRVQSDAPETRSQPATPAISPAQLGGRWIELPNHELTRRANYHRMNAEANRRAAVNGQAGNYFGFGSEMDVTLPKPQWLRFEAQVPFQLKPVHSGALRNPLVVITQTMNIPGGHFGMTLEQAGGGISFVTLDRLQQNARILMDPNPAPCQGERRADLRAQNLRLRAQLRAALAQNGGDPVQGYVDLSLNAWPRHEAAHQRAVDFVDPAYLASALSRTDDDGPLECWCELLAMDEMFAKASPEQARAQMQAKLIEALGLDWEKSTVDGKLCRSLLYMASAALAVSGPDTTTARMQLHTIAQVLQHHIQERSAVIRGRLETPSLEITARQLATNYLLPLSEARLLAFEQALAALAPSERNTLNLDDEAALQIQIAKALGLASDSPAAFADALQKAIAKNWP